MTLKLNNSSLLTYVTVAFWIVTGLCANAKAQGVALGQLQAMCPGCPTGPIPVPKPTCVGDCEGVATAEPTPPMLSWDDAAGITGAYNQVGRQEYDKGQKAYNARDWEKAERHFEKALHYSPNSDAARQGLQNARYMKGEAARQAEAAAAQARAREEYNRQMAEYNRQMAEYNKAKEAKEAADKLLIEQLNKNEKNYNAQLRKLEQEVSHVPPITTKPTKVIHEGYMLGMMNTQTQNSILGKPSPWTGDTITDDNIFASSDDPTFWKEFMRAFVDNSYDAEYTLNTPAGQKLIERIRGTHFDRLVAHSNGATIANALINRGIISVNELNIVGGDRSYPNFGGWEEMITKGKAARVVVWVNPGDIVPYGSSLSPLALESDRWGPLVQTALFGAAMTNQNSAALVQKMGETKARTMIDYAKDIAAFTKDRVTGNNLGGRSVDYRYMLGSEYKGQYPWQGGGDFIDPHDLGDAYFNNIGVNLGNKPAMKP